MEKEMATHSSILAWRIPWTEEPGKLQSMGSQRVGHNLATEQLLNILKQQIFIVAFSSLYFYYLSIVDVFKLYL